MIVEVRDAFKRNLPFLQWMDEETRKAAIEKVYRFLSPHCIICYVIFKKFFIR